MTNPMYDYMSGHARSSFPGKLSIILTISVMGNGGRRSSLVYI